MVVEAIDFSEFTGLAETDRERGAYEQPAAVYRGLADGIAENDDRVDAAYDHYARTFRSALDGDVECVVAADLDDEAFEAHLDHLSARAREAVGDWAEGYAAARDELEGQGCDR